LVVDSGRGIWAFWRLRRPEQVHRFGASTRRVESYGRGLTKAFGADNCQNIERIARLPAFANHKTNLTAKVLVYDAGRDCDLEDLPSAPLWENDGLSASHEKMGELIDDDAAKAAVTNYLTNSAPLAVEGRSGRKTTMSVLQKCQDLGCRLETAIELMKEHWNDRCTPPWESDEIEYTLRGLRRK